MELLVLIALIIVISIVIKYLAAPNHTASKRRIRGPIVYHYQRKASLMTRAESEFYKSLLQTVQGNYSVFSQVHLSAILDHKIKGQNWQAAFRHINGKSVDFVLCDSQNLKPLLGIELDDWSHDGDNRKQRDTEVERIFDEAGIPLLRLRDVNDISQNVLRNKIEQHLHSDAQLHD